MAGWILMFLLNVADSLRLKELLHGSFLFLNSGTRRGIGGWSINDCAVALRGFAHPKARRILNIYEQTRKHIAGGLFDDNTQSQKWDYLVFLRPFGPKCAQCPIGVIFDFRGRPQSRVDSERNTKRTPRPTRTGSRTPVGYWTQVRRCL